MILLHLKAQFAAFRPFVAGSYRQSAPFVTPTAAYGLFLNLAGIESRRVYPNLVATDTADDLPSCKIAIGFLREPERARMLQQLHNYPVGNTGKEHAEHTKGAKYNIQPVTREILIGIDGYIGLQGDVSLENAVLEGLNRGLKSTQKNGKPRYGVPFLGDNSFLIDVLHQVENPSIQTRWFSPLDLTQNNSGPLPGTGTCRMPIWIDRNDMTRTRTALFTPSNPAVFPPVEAWILIRPGS